MGNKTKNEQSQVVYETAMVWHERMLDPNLSDSEARAFLLWLEEDEKHAEIYNKLEDLNYALEAQYESLARTYKEEVQSYKSHRSNVVKPETTFWQNKKNKLKISISGAVAAAILLVMLIPNLGLLHTLPEPVAVEYTTSELASRQVHLDDGSVLDLNKNSTIQVLMRDEVRQVTLVKGEALFNVAKDNSRPFRVAVGDTLVNVVGTIFNVSHHKNRTEVTVSEGIVDVTHKENSSVKFRERLTVGKQLVRHTDKEGVQIKNIDAELVTAWLQGQLIFTDTPLSEIVAVLERYFGSQFEVSAEASKLKFTGVLNTDNEASILKLLELSLPIKVTYENNVIMIDIE